METKFTKGRWYVVPTRFGSIEGANVYYPHGFLTSSNVIPIDEVRLDGESWIEMRDRTKKQRKESELESIANMHLIAAAPEMYEALEMIKNEWNLECSDMDFIEMLLAKARGEHENNT